MTSDVLLPHLISIMTDQSQDGTYIGTKIVSLELLVKLIESANELNE